MRPNEGYKRCDYRPKIITGADSRQVYCENGYLVGTSMYDKGRRTLAHDPRNSARSPCPKCHGSGEIKDEDSPFWYADPKGTQI